MGKHAPSGIKVLPFDLIGEQQELQQAVAQAVASFPGVPLSYLVHNAGDVADGTIVRDLTFAMWWCHVASAAAKQCLLRQKQEGRWLGGSEEMACRSE